MQDAELLPFTSSLAGDPLEQMIAVGLVAKMRLLSAGIIEVLLSSQGMSYSRDHQMQFCNML